MHHYISKTNLMLLYNNNDFLHVIPTSAILTMRWFSYCEATRKFSRIGEK